MGIIAEQLKHPQQLASRKEVIGRDSIVPAVAGIYAWYFKVPPSLDMDLTSYWSQQGAYLLYVGISPSKPPANGKPPSKGTLRRRISTHMRGNASSSTLRYSVGCLLSQALDIQLRRVGRTERFYFSKGESVLSAWLEKNALVTWIPHNDPWLVEEEAISDLNLPLNLAQNRDHPYYQKLSRARRDAREEAKVLPVL
jgi:hypothetical protein